MVFNPAVEFDIGKFVEEQEAIRIQRAKKQEVRIQNVETFLDKPLFDRKKKTTKSKGKVLKVGIRPGIQQFF